MLLSTNRLLLILLLLPLPILAQVAWLKPSDPSPTDTVTLTFNTNEGNKGLEGWDGTVYLHTGAITEKSIDGGDWKHVIGNWGEDDLRVKMENAGNGLHQFTFVINDFYGLRDDEVVQQLAFVFRNMDGSRVGKTSNNEDILLPVNGYVPPVDKPAEYLFDSRAYVSHRLENNRLYIQTTHGEVHVVPYTTNIVLVKNFPAGGVIADSSDAIILDPQPLVVSLEDEEDHLRFFTDSLELMLFKDPWYISYMYRGDTILVEDEGYFERSDNNGLKFRIAENEKLYGLGERAVDFSLNGYKYNLYNRPKYGYEFPTLNLNYSIPLVFSSNGYILFFDNPQKGYADIGSTDPSLLEWGAIGGLMKYFVVAGNNPYSLMEQWGRLTGRQPLPPRWALGNLQSRMAYRTQEETDSIVNLMIAKDFPIDAIILDFYWFGDSIQGTMGRLKWYRPNWPDPEGMIQDFRNKGVKTVLITEPYIIDSLENFRIADELGILALDSSGSSYVNQGFYFGPGALIDIFKPKAREWFWEQYKPQIEKGVAGWWGDLGEPENHPSDQVHVAGMADEIHNVYAQYWHRMIFENYREHYPNKRLFNLNRAGYAGSQRYAIYPWTGDVSRSWGGFKAQVPTMLHMSMSGLPFIHSDAGGFAQGTKDEELYVRWLQMSCFSPILRPHGSGIPSEPVYFSKETQDIVRNYMQIRYRLLPYIYTTAVQANIMGYPITRPLFFDFPDDVTTYELGFQYMLGEQLLIAPVINPGQTTTEVYLPEGDWYDFWDNKRYAGNKWYTVATPLDNMPVFVKSGSFIPMVDAVNTTDNYSSANLTLKYYPGKVSDSAFFNMFEDDGKTYGTLGRGEFEYLRFKATHPRPEATRIELVREGWDYVGRPVIRAMSIEVMESKPEAKPAVFLDGKKLKRVKDGSKKPSYHLEDGRLNILFDWDGSYHTIDIEHN